mgnify:CR=1 FL=1
MPDPPARDEDLVRRLAANHEVLITIEEGARGGFGAFVLHSLAERGLLDKGLIKGEKPFNYSGENPNPYVVEHTDLINSIRTGNLLNEGEQVASSTLTAIGERVPAAHWITTGRRESISSRRCASSPKGMCSAPGVCPSCHSAVPRTSR